MKQAEELNKDYLSQKIKIPDEYPAKLDDTEGSEEIGEKFSIDEVLGEIKPGPTPVLDRCCRLEPSNYDTEVKYYFLRTDGINKIGRDPIKNTIIILDPSVSEEHIAIYREGKSYFMIVLKKSDKVFTYINGEPLVYLDL